MANAMIDFFELAAREKAHLPETWRVFHWQVLGHARVTLGYRLVGAVAPPKTRGKYKGKPNFDKLDKSTIRDVILLKAEYDSFVARWEVETGNCSRCQGSGQESAGWNVTDGPAYRPCSQCGATGRKQ